MVDAGSAVCCSSAGSLNNSAKEGKKTPCKESASAFFIQFGYNFFLLLDFFLLFFFSSHYTIILSGNVFPLIRCNWIVVQ